MKKKILITGATGDVGREIVKEMAAHRLDQYHIRLFLRPSTKNKKFTLQYKGIFEVVYGDITNRQDVEAAVEGVDAVIHSAAIIPPLADEEPEMARRTNVDGTAYLCEAFHRVQPQGKFIYTSSISVYGDRIENPEICCTDRLEPSLGDEYGRSKVDAERIVMESGLNWVIFRLTYISTPNKRLTPSTARILFHMPLDTCIEILESDDAAYALVQALEADILYKQIHNLAGGKKCRLTFREYLHRYFTIYGLGGNPLPEEAFATRNFHCGYLMDTDETEKVLRYQRHTMDDHFDRVDAAINPLLKITARIFRPLAGPFLTFFSEPYQVYRGKKLHLKERYFGITVEDRE